MLLESAFAAQKLFLVITLLGTPIYTLGPWPDTEEAVSLCQEGAVDIQARARGRIGEFAVAQRRSLQATDIVAECIHAERAPLINDGRPLKE